MLGERLGHGRAVDLCQSLYSLNRSTKDWKRKLWVLTHDCCCAPNLFSIQTVLVRSLLTVQCTDSAGCIQTVLKLQDTHTLYRHADAVIRNWIVLVPQRFCRITGDYFTYKIEHRDTVVFPRHSIWNNGFVKIILIYCPPCRPLRLHWFETHKAPQWDSQGHCVNAPLTHDIETVIIEDCWDV